jgi:hypothetical protein
MENSEIIQFYLNSGPTINHTPQRHRPTGESNEKANRISVYDGAIAFARCDIGTYDDWLAGNHSHHGGGDVSRGQGYRGTAEIAQSSRGESGSGEKRG